MNTRLIGMALLLSLSVPMAAQRSKARKAVVKKQPADLMAEKQNALFEEMLDGTQQLFVVDSVVTDKAQAIRQVPLQADLGRVVPYNEVFAGKGTDGAYVYVNGFGNKCYYAETDTTGTSRMYCREKLGGQWSAPQQIQGIGSDLKFINYPFMTSDGETLFFAAKGDEGLGGYDLYMTRYDSDEGRFLKAENLGLPYNSQADDVFYIEDDVHGFAWLATDRRQPEGKTCVYTIKTAKKRTNYSPDDYSDSKLKGLASISRIRDTWPTPQLRDKAMAELRSIGGGSQNAEADNDGEAFIVNDELSYNSPESFSAEGGRLYAQLIKLRQQKEETERSLDALRIKYHAATAGGRAALAAQIAAGEKKLDDTTDKIADITKRIRKTEADRQAGK